LAVRDRLVYVTVKLELRQEPKFGVRDRLAKEELLIELDHFGRSRAQVLCSSSIRVKKKKKKILVQTRPRTLKSKPYNQPTNPIHKIQKSKGQENRTQI
jgi:hypothetical protein